MSIGGSWEKTAPEVSSRMAAQRTSGTKPEIALRRELHARGRRFRVQYRPVPGFRRTPDITFTKAQLVVFVDGCFWHSCPIHATYPKTHAQAWEEKLRKNRERDQDTNRRYEDLGWTVVRVWEHESVRDAADRVEAALPPRDSGPLRAGLADATNLLGQEAPA